jgi:DNA-binding MarR family transcriptional regulator
MDRDLSRALHILTARLDRGADRILRAETGLSYSRFLALYMIRSFGADTQRALAERLGVTEPSASRMTRVLEQEGLVEAGVHPTGGNRNFVRLTPAGQRLVDRCRRLLEGRLAELVESGGVPYRRYQADTERLLDALDAAESTPRKAAQ